jgi:O-antigen/teichoic acid export membrane protein
LITQRFASNRLLKNVSANIAGSGWNGLLIILATPWYVSILGLEGYGIIGFWLLMQILFALFDLGLGATVVREFAASSSHNNSSQHRRDLLRTLEYVYWPLSVALFLMFYLSSGKIAGDWLNLNEHSIAQTSTALKWMALALGLQFPCALYTSGLAGLQRQVRMNALQMSANTLRHGCGVLVLWWKVDIIYFFIVQASVAGLQTMATMMVLWHLERTPYSHRPEFRLTLLRSVWRFSAGMAITMVAGTVLVNVDRLVLSKLLPTEELGKYTLAWMLASFLQLGIQPFYRAYFPRFSESIANNELDALRTDYYQGCKYSAWVIIPTAVISGIFARDIYFMWVGSNDETVVSVFRWLLIGVAGSGLMWLPAAFQQAHGWTRLHAAMIIAPLAIGLPAIWWAIKIWGTVGATIIWVMHGISDVTLGLWLMHRRLLKGEFIYWYRKIITPPLLTCTVIGLASWWSMPAGLGRWASASWVGTTALVAILSLLLFSKANNMIKAHTNR